MKRIIILCGIALLCLMQAAHAQEQYWSLVDEQGRFLTCVCYEPQEGDGYISESNRQYTVLRVEGDRAILRDDGDVAMPELPWLSGVESAQTVSAAGTERSIAMYCTHSDESYEPTDGYYTTSGRGSIYEVAGLLAEELSLGGIPCEVADTLHHPHDAGAYRRSRQTAMQLVRTAPDALFDIHRDGIPNPEEYLAEIGGREVSRIRLLVGRGNQNMEVNKRFALTLKATADQVYPKLIKDIYMGKGAFNQDLLPRALLLECGTYTLGRETVEASMPMLADVITRTLYGGKAAAEGALTGRQSIQPDDVTPGATDAPEKPLPGEGKAAGQGMVWLLGLAAIGLIVFGVVQTGSLRGGMRKSSRHLSEMTGGLLGKGPEDEKQEDRRDSGGTEG